MRCGDPTWMAQNFGFLEMSNFDIYAVESAFGAILGDPKFGSFHVGSPHLMAVTGHSWLTLVGNSNNEVCSPSNNTVSKAFWQKKVLPQQRISYCEGIYLYLGFSFNMVGHTVDSILPFLAWEFFKNHGGGSRIWTKGNPDIFANRAKWRSKSHYRSFSIFLTCSFVFWAYIH